MKYLIKMDSKLPVVIILTWFFIKRELYICLSIICLGMDLVGFNTLELLRSLMTVQPCDFTGHRCRSLKIEERSGEAPMAIL
ncbi:hypothetical protein P308_06180 [Pseudomonas piscis]|nr:hypothetical protein P308_06180 [Pseudomonas piscis]